MTNTYKFNGPTEIGPFLNSFCDEKNIYHLRNVIYFPEVYVKMIDFNTEAVACLKKDYEFKTKINKNNKSIIHAIQRNSMRSMIPEGSNISLELIDKKLIITLNNCTRFTIDEKFSDLIFENGIKDIQSHIIKDKGRAIFVVFRLYDKFDIYLESEILQE